MNTSLRSVRPCVRTSVRRAAAWASQAARATVTTRCAAVVVAGAMAGAMASIAHAAPPAEPGTAPAALRAIHDRATLSTLSGTWASTQPEPWYGAYGTREFTFDRGQWRLRFTFALDPAMQAKVFEFRTGGPYYIAQASRSVAGAFDAVFMEDAKFVTLRTRDPKLLQAFGLATCGLVADVEKDISGAGCAAWKPVAQCREDHDLLALGDGGGLHFGVRPRDNDMCTSDKRPTALLPAVVRR